MRIYIIGNAGITLCGIFCWGSKPVVCMASSLSSPLREALAEAAYQRCYVHFLRNALDYVPRKVDDDCLPAGGGSPLTDDCGAGISCSFPVASQKK
jgi:hypothetical protein